jgi:hypothetical protein
MGRLDGSIAILAYPALRIDHAPGRKVETGAADSGAAGSGGRRPGSAGRRSGGARPARGTGVRTLKVRGLSRLL